jgi:hypothetical protein
MYTTIQDKQILIKLIAEHGLAEGSRIFSEMLHH